MKTHKNITALIWAFIIIISTTHLANSQVFWRDVVSEKGLFKTFMRKEYQQDSVMFVIDAREGLLHEKVQAYIDQRPYQKILKNYSVEGVQTFTSIERPERITLAKQGMDRLIERYEQYDHVIEKRVEWPIPGEEVQRRLDRRMEGEVVELVYNHPEFGPQAVRAQVLIGKNTRIIQIADISPNALSSAKIINFFSSLRTEDRVVKTNTKIENHWRYLPAPSNLFSIYLPKTQSLFFPEKPHIKKTENGEIIRALFRDPIREQNILYSNYAFQNTEDFTFEEVERLIGENFIKRHGREPSRVELRKKIINSKPLMYTEYAILPTKNFPEQNFAMLHVYFKGKVLFVQEVLGPKRLVKSSFIANIMKLHHFDPPPKP